MTRKSFLTALLVLMAVLGAEAQKNNVYKADTVIDGNGNKIITVYSRGTFAEGNGNVVTRDFEVMEFDEISLVLPATVNFTVADDYTCRVTLDENLFEYLYIHQKGGDLNLQQVPRYEQINLMPTKFVIEISAPAIEEITLTGSGDFCFVTPFEARKLKITRAGSGEVYFMEMANIRRFSMSIAGSGKLICKDFHSDYTDVSVAGSGEFVCEHLYADQANLSVAGSGDIVIEAGTVKSADVSVAGSGSIETRCQIESMDYSIAGTGTIEYYGDVKVKGTCMLGKISRIDSEKVEKK